MMATLLDAHLDTLVAAVPPFRSQAPRLAYWGRQLASTLGRGGRLLVAGNGGSAEQAQHLAAELVGKLRDDRPALSAIALCTPAAGVTAISNDYGYERLFARQVEAHGRPGDVLLALSTSGRSRNLLAAVDTARKRGLRRWALTGPAPNPLVERCPEAVVVSCPDPQVVQELHLVAIHALCDYLERALPGVPGVPGDLAAAGRAL
jgi:D-sedoheptulose 7-phosphate isomerase